MSEMNSGLHPAEGPVASPAPVDGGVVGPRVQHWRRRSSTC